MDTVDRKDEFAKMLDEIHRQLFGYIFAMVRDLEQTQDLYQETCLVMWRKFDEFEGRAKFGTWACSIARYHVLNHHRSRRKSPAQLSDAFAEQIAAFQMSATNDELDSRNAAAEHCLGKLADSERTVISECYSGRVAVSEMAERLGRSTSGTYAMLRRIREKVLVCVERVLAGRQDS